MEFQQQEGGTFLEEFLQSIELLPNDVRRNFELMRELDRDSIEAIRELTETEKKCMQKLSKRKDKEEHSHQSQDLLETINFEEIKTKRQRAKQKTGEKISIAEQTLELVESRLRKLDTDLAYFETILRASGEFESGYAESGQDVAIKPDVYEDLWILGRVITYHQDTGMYEIADVSVLDTADRERKLAKGEEVIAVYPDTTSFYPATVSQAPRRTSVGVEPTLTVQFHGDADEMGLTPHRIVPLKYVTRPPVRHAGVS
eukprot:gene12897-27210_t